MAKNKPAEVSISDESREALVEDLAEVFFASLQKAGLTGSGGGRGGSGGIGGGPSRPPQREEPIIPDHLRRQVDGWAPSENDRGLLLPPDKHATEPGQRSKNASVAPSMRQIIPGMFGGRPGFGKNQLSAYAEANELDGNGPMDVIPSFYGGNINWQTMAQMAVGTGHNKDPNAPILGEGLRGAARGLWHRGTFQAGRVGAYANENAYAIEHAQMGVRKLRDQNAKLDRLGTSLGAVPGEGFGSSFGPMRLPFLNPAARKGAAATIDSMWSAGLSPGISVKEDAQLKQEIAALGYSDGSERAKEMLGESSGGIFGIGGHEKSGLRELYQFDPRVADPEMMDKATRYGGQSVKDFVATMKGVPDAARSASISVEQMKSDMSALGEWSQSHGGTWAQGAGIGPTWSSVTGTSPQVGLQMLQSPVGQSQIYRESGLMPQMQGLLDPMALTGSTVRGFMDSYRNAGRYSTKTMRNEKGFVTGVVGGAEQKAAMVAEQWGLSPEVTSALAATGDLENWASGIEGREVATGGLDAINQARIAANNGNERGERRWNRVAGRNLKEARRLMRDAVDDNGERLFSEDDMKDIAENAGGSIKGLKQGDTDDISDGDAESIAKYMEKLPGGDDWDGKDAKAYVREHTKNMGASEYRRFKKQYRTAHMLEEFRSAATEREKERAEDGGGSQMIELGPHARQYFDMVSPKAQAGAVSRAGGAPTNAQYTNPNAQSSSLYPSQWHIPNPD